MIYTIKGLWIIKYVYSYFLLRYWEDFSRLSQLVRWQAFSLSLLGACLALVLMNDIQVLFLCKRLGPLLLLELAQVRLCQSSHINLFSRDGLTENSDWRFLP